MTGDNTCKYLAERYPSSIARWLLKSNKLNVQVLKTELVQEPVRADSILLLQIGNKILHVEFQTLPYSKPPIPYRMFRYWFLLYDQYQCEIEQVVVYLKRTSSKLVLEKEFRYRQIHHPYRVVRLWEQDPALFLADPALLPFAPLARSDSPAELLQQVASEVAKIEEPQQRDTIASCTGILAGLMHDENLIRQLFGEEIMEESSFYQYILRKGAAQGELVGRQQEAVSLVTRQIARKLGELAPNLSERIGGLSTQKLEDLGEALLDFAGVEDLVAWLNEQAPA